MISKLQNTITVQQLYDYAVQHNYLNADVTIVLDIINRESNSDVICQSSYKESFVNPINDASTIDFSTLVEYTIDDLLTLLSI